MLMGSMMPVPILSSLVQFTLQLKAIARPGVCSCSPDQSSPPAHTSALTCISLKFDFVPGNVMLLEKQTLSWAWCSAKVVLCQLNRMLPANTMYQFQVKLCLCLGTLLCHCSESAAGGMEVLAGGHDGAPIVIIL